MKNNYLLINVLKVCTLNNLIVFDMKKNTLILLFSCLCFQWSAAQTPDLSRYKQQVQRLSEDVAYFDVEKINDQFYMIIGGGGNVGVFVGDSEVILIDNK